MGIDTVKLRSPSLDEGTAQFLEKQSILKSGVDLASGEVLYEITTGELEGSWDSRVSFKVMRDDWVQVAGRIEKVACEPYVMLEASLHKFFHGQNVFGSVTDFRASCGMFVDLVGELLTGDGWPSGQTHEIFHSADGWQVRRVDWAEMFCLTPAAQRDFFRGISQAKFPRRSAKSAKYGLNAVYFPGTFTTLKLYDKGAEFREHDVSRIRRSLTVYFMKQLAQKRDQGFTDDWMQKRIVNTVKALQRLANNRLRVEVEVHADKFKYDFEGRFPTVAEMTDEYLKKVHDAEIFKLLREGKTEMETVRTHDAVVARLSASYSPRSANALYAFWLQLSARGEDVVRDQYSKSQFYSNRSKLVEAGVSWLSSDVFIVANDSALPRDFMPMRSDSRRCGLPVSSNSVFNFCPVEWGQLKAA